MRPWRAGRWSAAAAVVALGVVVLVSPAGAQAASPSPLHRQGGQLVDAQGRVVVLHGVNVVWKSPPFYPPDTFGGLTDADLDRIAAHGWNVIRLGVIPEGMMPTKGHVDDHYLDEIAATIDRIGAHGLYALLDVHQDLMGPPWGNGFPSWSIHQSPALEQTEPNLGFPLNAVRPSHSLAWDAFWADQKLAPGDPKGPIGYLADSLGALAARVRDNPAVAGIEILNEAWAGTPFVTCAATPTVGCPVVDAYVQRTWERLTDRIRQADPDALVWWEPTSLFNTAVATALDDPPLTPKVTDPQLGFAFHDYCAFGELSTYLGLPTALQQGCDAYHDVTWTNAAAMRTRSGWPQLVTEFGNITDPVELARALRRSDAQLTGWMYWHYGPGRAVPTDPGEPFTAGQLQQLSRAYPAVTAGVPGAYSFDPATGEVHYSYRATSEALTILSLGDVHYPDGWSAGVTGAEIVGAGSTPDQVGIIAKPGAEVTVLVRPASGADVVRLPTTTVPPTPTPPPHGRRTLPATGGGSGLARGTALAAMAVVVRAVARGARRRG
jgi:endoglycosylceramidase